MTTSFPRHADVFPDDILARLRDLEQNSNDLNSTVGDITTGTSDDIDVEGGTIVSYSSGVASVLLDDGETVNVTILNAGSDLAFGLLAGPVLIDRTDGHQYRIKVTAGVLGTEVVV